MSGTLVLRPAPAPRRLVYTVTAVVSVVLIIAGVMAGGRPGLVTCVGLVLLLAAAIDRLVDHLDPPPAGRTGRSPSGSWPASGPAPSAGSGGTRSRSRCSALGFAVLAVVLGTVVAALSG
ncbi:hypothetical protein E1212_25930 [Jiangella ureilytica]|uniref:Uncharacterized protein n=1 Tax=Jiangella ureilytica TaxID=2530374 RepID=A0A4R4RCG0_9ACTN|nr:hypothetical protein [Jiangella ureilytica]TDC46810.1 hypothetical protein E1212_25930 [Jiangella ureilytica]